MTNFRILVIVPLNATHERARFHCNVAALDQYIHKQAGQDIKRRISRIFVAALPDNPNTDWLKTAAIIRVFVDPS